MRFLSLGLLTLLSCAQPASPPVYIQESSGPLSVTLELHDLGVTVARNMFEIERVVKRCDSLSAVTSMQEKKISDLTAQLFELSIQFRVHNEASK